MRNFLISIAGFFRKATERISNSPVLKNTLIAVLSVLVLLGSFAIAVFTVSLSVRDVVSDRIISTDEASLLEDIDCILVLGAGLRADGSPSDMLADRLKVGVSLVKNGVCDNILMSGDNSGEHYNEVAAMSLFAVEQGIATEKITLDGKGFSTYESIFNALNEYGAKRIVIVTQEYHLYRALYIARALGMEAWGVHADLRSYRGQNYRDLREHFARFKDFILTVEKD